MQWTGRPFFILQHSFCDSGHLSTGVWFVAHELMGNPNVKMYDGSMHEWTKDAGRPVTTAKE